MEIIRKMSMTGGRPRVAMIDVFVHWILGRQVACSKPSFAHDGAVFLSSM